MQKHRLSHPTLVLLLLVAATMITACGTAPDATVNPTLPSAKPTPTTVTTTPPQVNPTATQPRVSATSDAATPTDLPAATATIGFPLGQGGSTSEDSSGLPLGTMELIAAAERGDVEAVQRLLAQGADIHARDQVGKTALIAAAYNNHLKVEEMLIKAGADVNAKDNTQQSAYLISTSEGYLDLLKLTLQAGGDVHSLDSYNGTGLIRAADRGHIEIIEELLKTDIKIDHVNRLGWTALLEAIILGGGSPRHIEVVRLLVEAGADVNLADGNGVTPLAHARQRGYQEMITILVNAGAQ